MTTASAPAQQLRDGTATGTWILDPAESTITTATKHFWGLITVRGTFTKLTGHADVSTDGTTTAALEIDAASITTKNKKRDEHLRSDDFFASDRHPTITFMTTDITITGDTTAKVTGVLTAGGAQQTVTFDASLATTDHDHATVTADVNVDHKALGMTWSPLGMAKPTTTLALSLTFHRG
jgi:polyisoprenoid-binding protein YceI